MRRTGRNTMEEQSAAQPRSKVPAWLVPAVVAVAAAAVPFVIMTTERRFRLSVPIGFVACVVSAFAALQAVGSFSSNGERVVRTTTLGGLAPRLYEFVGTALLHLGAL